MYSLFEQIEQDVNKVDHCLTTYTSYMGLELLP